MRGSHICISFPLGVVENLGVINWGYHQQVGTKWKITPSPSPDGRINLQPTGYSWITWYSETKEPITFDLGVSGMKLAKIEFTCKQMLIGGVQ